MYHPTDRIIHTTAFVTPVVEHWLEREIAQWVHLFFYGCQFDTRVKDRPWEGATGGLVGTGGLLNIPRQWGGGGAISNMTVTSPTPNLGSSVPKGM